MITHLRDFARHRAGRSIGIIFATSGLVFGSWASFIPYIKEKFSLDEAQLGLLLLSMPFGVFIVNPVSVILIRQWGAVRTALLCAVLTAVAFFFALSMPWILLAAIGLVMSGAAFGITNVSMNTCASALEEKSHLGLISTCHGMWSVGAMLGALLSGLSLIPFEKCCGQFVQPQILFALIQALIVSGVIGCIRNNFGELNDVHVPAHEAPEFSLKMMKPPKELWIIISICICTYLSEGTITDWSSVYLREETLASETVAGWGFAVYAFFMAGGRFLGDQLIARYGSMRVLRGGGILVVIGLAIIIMSGSHLMAMPGFMLTGAGISIASPILYQASAKIKGLAPGIGLATMNMFAMIAFLGGPVLIGFIAKLSNLRIAFGLVAVMAVIWILQTTKVIRSHSA